MARAAAGLCAALLVVGGRGDWCDLPPTSVVDLTSHAAAKGSSWMHPIKFVVAMMGPRVGSKMVRSMLESWGGGGRVECDGEGLEARLTAAYPGRGDRYRLGKFYGAAERRKSRAVGFKTEKFLVFDGEGYDFGDFYANATAAAAGIRVVCLGRLNAVAREASGDRKGSGYARNASLACGGEGADDVAAVWRRKSRAPAFFAACERLGATTRTLWLPYEVAIRGTFNSSVSRSYASKKAPIPRVPEERDSLVQR